ncbi:MAG: hypothetical protein ACYC6H_05555 [Bellilinea sp.]
MSEIICPHCGSSNNIEALECTACHKSLYEEPTQPYTPSADNEMAWLKDYRSLDSDDSFISDEESEPETGSASEPGFEAESSIAFESKIAPKPAQDPGSEPEIPEWLARIRARAQEEGPPPDSPPIEPFVPDEQPKYKVGEPITTDFLRDFRATEDQPAPEDQKESYPDWLKRISARNVESREIEPDIKSAPFDFGSGHPEEEPIVLPEEDEEFSSFLREDAESEPAPVTTPEQASNFAFEDPFSQDLTPDLDSQLGLSTLEDAEFDLEETEFVGVSPEKEGLIEPEGLPTFLFEELPAEEVQDEIGSLEEVGEVPNLDWLDESFVATPEEAASTDDKLDWLKIENEEPDQPSMAEVEVPTGAAGLPDWLLAEEASPTDKEISARIFGTESVEGDEEELAAEEEPVYSEESLPDWLLEDEAGITPVESALEPELAPDKEGFPDWLQEIQPTQSRISEKTPDITDEKIEAIGPLAGYQGILPGEVAVTHYTKPPLYSAQLQVTDKQRILAALFDTLISEEVKPQVKGTARAAISPQVLRLVAGIFMAGIVIIALISNANLSILPSLYPPENVAFYNTVQSVLTPDTSSRVLVGLDYEPALAGEVGTAANAVLRDLMAGNTNLIFISLNATGPALSQDLVKRANSDVPEYQAAEHVVNLGYLPGGASALAGLAAAPSRTAPVAIDGTTAWDSGPLQGATSLDDFNAVILLTDNTESARTWIEQIQTNSREVPFLLVSSAQSAPALQPYVQSGQVVGMIGGLNGAAAYQQLSQVPSEPLNGYWGAFQAGMLLMAAFILLGAMVHGIKYLATKFKKA